MSKNGAGEESIWGRSFVDVGGPMEVELEFSYRKCMLDEETIQRSFGLRLESLYRLSNRHTNELRQMT